jgi:hypothetical protein
MAGVGVGIFMFGEMGQSLGLSLQAPKKDAAIKHAMKSISRPSAMEHLRPVFD